MEKRLYIKKCLAVIACTFAMINGANAFLLPPMPWSISFDGVADVSGGVEGGGNVAVSGMEKAQQKVTDVLDKIKKTKADIESKIDDVKGNFEEKIAGFKDKVGNFVGDKVNNVTGMLHGKKKGDSTIATTREIQECEVADISSEDSIVEAFEVLFGQYPEEILKKYPEDQEGVKNAYANKAVEFSNDAMIELYITAREMDDRMDVLQKEIDGMSDKYVMGTTVEAKPEISGETGDANDELGSWVNYYKVVKIYDSILRITDELSALDAQYEAAQALRKGIKPKEANVEEQEASLNFDMTLSSAYAQQGGLSSLLKKVDLSKIKEAAGNIVSVKSRTAQSAFKGSADKFEDLQALNPISFTLNEAMEIHNLLQQLDNFRESFVEYNRMKALHKEVIKRLKVSEDCVVAHLGRYYKDPYSAWLGKGCNYTTGLEIFCDEGIEVTKENLRNVTEGDHLCSNDKSKICSVFGINRYERRGGLSGWLLSAYQVAKVEKTLEASTDELSPQVNDNEISGVPEISKLEDMEEVEAQGIAADEQGLNDSVLSPSEEEKMQETTRERDILAWQLGALTAKKLGAEMAEDKGSVYGPLKNKYPLWNDEKYFYAKYLEGKYDNMEIFIKSIDLRDVAIAAAAKISDMLYVEETEEEKEAEDYEGPKMRGVLFEKVLEYNKIGFDALRKKLGSSSSPSINSLEKIQQSWDAIFSVTSANLDKALEKQNKLKEELYKELDAKSKELNEAKKKYNEVKEEKSNLENNVKADKLLLETSATRSAKSQHVNSQGMEQSSEKSIADSIKAIAIANSNLKVALAKVDGLRSEIDELKSKLKLCDTTSAALKAAYTKKVAEFQYQKEKKLTEAYEELKTVKAPKLSSLVSDNVPGTKAAIFSEIINIVSTVEQLVKERALKAVKGAYNDILDMNDERFDTEKYFKIVNIHKRAMSEVENFSVDLSDFVSLLKGYINVSAMEKVVANMLSEALFDVFCNNNICYKKDTEYYVAITPNEKDTTIPKKISPSYTPPLREIVHLDGVDFDNMNINEDLIMSKSSFVDRKIGSVTDAEGVQVTLDLVPPIWYVLLGEKGFVEKDVPLIPLFEQDMSSAVLIDKDGDTIAKAEETGKMLNDLGIKVGQISKIDELMKGGMYPCSFDGRGIDVYKGNYALVYDYNYPKCRHIKSLDDKGVKKTFTTLDGVEIRIREKSSLRNVNMSELSLFGQMSPLGFTFNKDIKEIMEYLDNLDDKYDKEAKDKSDKVMLDRNQFGDYLKFVEQELEYQKGLEQLSVKVEKARSSLKEEFAKFNYTPKPDFDLSDIVTYAEIVKVMNVEKDNRVKEADKKLKGIKGKNELLQEKIEQLNNTLLLLKLDSQEQISLSESVSVDSLMKELVRAQTDKDAMKGYDKEVEKSYNEKSDGFMAPYCAVY